MDGFKTFYNEKKGKYILFFGFYIIFFIFIAIYVRSYNANNPKEEKKEEQVIEKITTYDISSLINNNYSYNIKIIDNGEMVSFSGTKDDIDYANYQYKYFLDIYNLNQLLKRSKLINSENYVLLYELENKEINDILLTEKNDGINKIAVYVNGKTEVEKIYLDLTNYLEKEIFEIAIDYSVGDNSENSSSWW